MSDEGICVSQCFPGVDDCWIVSGCNPNRSPKIAYLPTREEAERTAEVVRGLIREAVLRQLKSVTHERDFLHGESALLERQRNEARLVARKVFAILTEEWEQRSSPQQILEELERDYPWIAEKGEE